MVEPFRSKSTRNNGSFMSGCVSDANPPLEIQTRIIFLCDKIDIQLSLRTECRGALLSLAEVVEP